MTDNPLKMPEVMNDLKHNNRQDGFVLGHGAFIKQTQTCKYLGKIHGN